MIYWDKQRQRQESLTTVDGHEEQEHEEYVKESEDNVVHFDTGYLETGCGVFGTNHAHLACIKIYIYIYICFVMNLIFQHENVEGVGNLSN